MYQEIHPYRVISIDRVLINTFLVMIRGWNNIEKDKDSGKDKDKEKASRKLGWGNEQLRVRLVDLSPQSCSSQPANVWFAATFHLLSTTVSTPPCSINFCQIVCRHLQTIWAHYTRGGTFSFGHFCKNTYFFHAAGGGVGWGWHLFIFIYFKEFKEKCSIFQLVPLWRGREGGIFSLTFTS